MKRFAALLIIHRDRTPAMALGITDRVMSVGDILRTPLIPTAA